MISVVIAYYDGMIFFEEQIQSILLQIKSDDELIIVDDCSKIQLIDIDYMKNFMSEHENIVIIRNDQNLGSKSSFQAACTKAKGELIFFADQDDVWDPHKVEKILGEFLSDPDLGLVFSNAQLINRKNQVLPGDLWTHYKLDKHKKCLINRGEALRVLLQNDYITGATMVVRNKHLRKCFPFSEYCEHDAWIALILALLGVKMKAIDAKLVLYRQHSNQQIGAKKRSILTRILETKNRSHKLDILIARHIEAYLHVIRVDPNTSEKNLVKLHRKIHHLKLRNSKRSIAKIFYTSLGFIKGDYNRFSESYKSFILDQIL